MPSDTKEHVIIHNSHGIPEVLRCTVANAKALLDDYLNNLDPAIRKVADYRLLAETPVHIVNTRLITAALEELITGEIGAPAKSLRWLKHGPPPRTPAMPIETPTPGVAEAPLPYNLKTLQADTKRLFGMSSKQTLAVAQALYEKSMLSYPKTDCQYLALSQKEDVPQTLSALAHNFHAEVRTLRKTGIELRDFVFDDAKVAAHHAIVPTLHYTAELLDVELQVFTLVAQRYLQSLSAGLQFASMFPPPKPADERPEEFITQALRDEVVLWAFKHKLDANKLGSNLDYALHKLAPHEGLSFMAGVVARAQGKPLQYVEPSVLDAADELQKLRQRRWKPDAPVSRIVEQYLSFIREHLANSRNDTFDVAELTNRQLEAA